MANAFKVDGRFGRPVDVPALPELNNDDSDGDSFKVVLNGGAQSTSQVFAAGFFSLNPLKMLGYVEAWGEILSGDWLRREGKYIDAERRYDAAQNCGNPWASRVALARIAKMYERWGMELQQKGALDDAIEKFQYAIGKWESYGGENMSEQHRIWGRIGVIYQDRATALAGGKRYAEAVVEWVYCIEAWNRAGSEEVASVLTDVMKHFGAGPLLEAAEAFLQKGTQSSEAGRHDEALKSFQRGASLAAMAAKAKAEGAIETRLGKIQELLDKGMTGARRAVRDARMVVGSAFEVVGRLGNARNSDLMLKYARDAAAGNKTAMKRLKEELAARGVTHDEFIAALRFDQRHKLAEWGLDSLARATREPLLARVGRLKMWGGRPIGFTDRFMRETGR